MKNSTDARVEVQRLRPAALVIEPADVLFEASSWRRWFLRMLGNVDGRKLACACDAKFQTEYLPEVLRGWRSREDALRDCLIALGLRSGQAAELAAAGEQRWRAMSVEVRPLPGVVAALDDLRAGGTRVALLADCDLPCAELKTRLKVLRIVDDGDSVLTSRETGAVKPERRAYQAALEALNLPAGQCAFVGHRPDELAGAASQGLRTVAIGDAAGAIADVYLPSAAQLAGPLVPSRDVIAFTSLHEAA